jgi:hypothetical protein
MKRRTGTQEFVALSIVREIAGVAKLAKSFGVAGIRKSPATSDTATD